MDISNFNVDTVWNKAIKILQEIGLKTENERMVRKLSRTLQVKDGYITFDQDTIEHFRDELREKGEKSNPEKKELTILNSNWCYNYIDPQTQEIKPLDTQTLIRHTKLTCQLEKEGLMGGGVAGYPLDVSPPLQLLTAYYINCCYNSRPYPLTLISSKEVVKFVLAIAEIMGFELEICVEPISPLTCSGNSLDIALDFFQENPRIEIDTMPIMGITAPLDWYSAWAQTVAENVGTYIIFRLCGFEKVDPPSFRLFLPNMLSGMVYFSSPKHIFALLARRKIREFFNLDTDFCELMLVTSKLPDQQAAIEKTAGCLLAKLFGFYYVRGAGALSMDKIFSTQQLIIDVEIRNFVEKVETEFKETEEDVVGILQEGIKLGSFLSTDSTLERYEEYSWRPLLFDLSIRSSGDRKEALDKARKIAEEKLKIYDYELTGEKREKIERIMAEARNKLSSLVT